MNTKTKFIRILFMLICSFVLMLACNSIYAVSLPFEDGFENSVVGDHPDENGWQILFSGKTAVVSDNVACSGEKSFYLDSNPNWARMDYVQLNEVPNYLTYEASVYLDPNDGKNSMVGFMQAFGSQGPTWNKIGVDAINGKVWFEGEEGHLIGNYTPGTWCSVRVQLDFVRLKGNIWLDGDLVAVEVNIRPKEFDSGYGHHISDKWGVVSGNYSPSSGSSNVVYFDDLSIQETEIIWAQSVLHEIGDWNDVNDLLGPPDANYARTANRIKGPWSWASLSTGAAVWLDFGRTVHGGTIVVYHDDPGGHHTDLAVGSSYGVPHPEPQASDNAYLHANIQGNGSVTCYVVAHDFRYVRLDHFTTDPNFQDGIDAVAVIEGDVPGRGVYLNPPPQVIGSPNNAVDQLNNGYWHNANAVIGVPDDGWAQSRNPSHTMPHMVVDLGRVVYSGTVLIHHDDPYPMRTSLAVSINSRERDTDPNTCPPWPGADGWEGLWTGHAGSGVTTLHFPPTHFRYIQFGQSQTSPGQEDGIDALEVYVSPFCTERPAMDYNNDCKVDFGDFAIFAGSWLECNLEPPEACWE